MQTSRNTTRDQSNLIAALHRLFSAGKPPENSHKATVDQAELVTALYQFFFNRNPEPEGLALFMNMLQSGESLEHVLTQFANSEEFAVKSASNANFSAARSALLAAQTNQADGHRLLENIFHTMPWKAEDRPAVVSYPFSLFNIELTNKCPFKCIMCPRTNHMMREQGLMEFSLFTKVIDELIAVNPAYRSRENLVWLHHFGESLVHPEVATFIKYASDRQVPVSLSINPLMLSKKISEELIDANPKALLISLDGHDNESFEKIRGVKNVFDQSKKNLLAFLNRKVERNSGIEITLSVVDFPTNEMSKAEQRDKWRETWMSVPGIDAFEWKPFTSWDGSSPEITALDGKSHRVSAEFENVRAAKFKVTCGWPWSKMNITWDGDVVPCCYDHDKKYVLGNVATQTLAQIWNSEKMIALRREFSSNRVTNKLCAQCEYLY